MAGLDFGKLTKQSVVDTATEPRRIFAALPARDRKYARPWDVQTQVWERWHDRRSQSDLLIKMNTGGGKTVVGLMMLKSCLNEGTGPAVYVTPDIYLAGQVRAEAGALGIETTDDPRSGRFQAGKAILVTHIHKVINGRSVFGVWGSRTRHTWLTSGDRMPQVVGRDRHRVAALAVSDLPAGAEAGLAVRAHGVIEGCRVVGAAS